MYVQLRGRTTVGKLFTPLGPVSQQYSLIHYATVVAHCL